MLHGPLCLTPLQSSQQPWSLHLRDRTSSLFPQTNCSGWKNGRHVAVCTSPSTVDSNSTKTAPFSSAYSTCFCLCVQVLHVGCRHSLLAPLFHLQGFWGPDPWLFVHGFLGPILRLFSFLFIIFQLIDLHVYEVFDTDPHVVRYFWWYHYSHFHLFTRLYYCLGAVLLLLVGVRFFKYCLHFCFEDCFIAVREF